ncbi:substrate-binding domain-containing protein [Catenovulum sp. 2E275]|uniref:substrate-binding domain-containing protein n=1 Tax=Catenovulum sp. 2E275 TaxID=2980497 RepID=UPI0021CDEE06|nr:substrate-binding domain-containing protein [Catenovulum sp. 2E275]MCU4677255.1 substrate-binding domain-containing protein [Catenovulum sp. 2E275]
MKLSNLICLCFFAQLLPTPSLSKPLTIGVAINDLNNPFFQQIVKGAKRKADELSNNQAIMMVVSSDYILERQKYQLSQLVERKADIIVLTGAEQTALKQDIQKAIKAGSQVIAVDVATDGVIATVATDNVKAGEIACHYLAEQINKTGKVAIIDGPAVSAVKDRVTGCIKALNQYTSITLVKKYENGQGNQQGGSLALKILLQNHSDIRGIFAINDPSAIGAELYAQNTGKRDLVITSVDGAPIMQKALKSDAALVAATSAQYPDQMAEKAVELGFALMQGQTLNRTVFLIDPSLVTKQNVYQYQGWVE